MRYLFLLILIFQSSIFATSYPNKPIEFVVGFGKGGSTDRMIRNMTFFLEEELKVRINVVNIKEKATLEATNYVLDHKHDGYTVLASSLSPYLLNTILTGKAEYTLDDFAIINLQWFDFEFISVGKDSSFDNIVDILDFIKKNPKKLNVGIMNKSSGNISFNLLLEKFNIPFKNVNLKLFQGGRKARFALINKDIDVLIISAQGSEKYREEMKPIAVLSKKRSKRWDAPTINEALKDTGISIPVINGSIRGFAVPKKFKEKYPERFEVLEKAIKKTLAKRKVQTHLKKNKIGYYWTGPELSTKILEDSYETFKRYNYLIEN